jgi:hypothetical protein
MKPFLAKGYAKRKLHTGNQSVQFDEEREVERPLFYSTFFRTSDCVKTQLLSQPQIPNSTDNRFIYSEKQLFHSFPINQTQFFLHSPQISPNLTKKTSNLG